MIQSIKVEYLVSQLSSSSEESSHGLHSLIIYPDLVTLREFYSYYVQKQIEEKNEVVLINPFYETTDSVRQTLSKGHRAIDVDKYERQEKTLVIMDSLEKYLGQKEKEKVTTLEEEGTEETGIVLGGIKDESKWWFHNQQMIDHSKNLGNKMLSILADVGAFYYKNKTMELLEYESSLPQKFDMDLKGVCIYNEKDFDRLSEEQKQELVKHHGMAVRLEAH
jgi:hypothetical protein